MTNLLLASEYEMVDVLLETVASEVFSQHRRIHVTRFKMLLNAEF